MKSNLLNGLILAALVMPGAAMAADAASDFSLSSNVGVVSNYVFRGITQTVGKPAVQGGMDLSHSSGLYAGVWGSNVDWILASGSVGNSSLEMDAYAGYKGTATEDISYDVGLVRYNYLGNYTPPAGYVKADTSEAYGSIAYQWLSMKYSYSLGDFLTVPKASGTNYLEVNASYTLEDAGVSLGAHYGKQTYKGAAADALAVAGTSATYSDYKVSVSKDFSGYVLGLAYTNTNAPMNGYYTFAGKNWGASAVAASLTHSF